MVGLSQTLRSWIEGSARRDSNCAICACASKRGITRPLQLPGMSIQLCNYYIYFWLCNLNCVQLCSIYIYISYCLISVEILFCPLSRPPAPPMVMDLLFVNRHGKMEWTSSETNSMYLVPVIILIFGALCHKYFPSDRHVDRPYAYVYIPCICDRVWEKGTFRAKCTFEL